MTKQVKMKHSIKENILTFFKDWAYKDFYVPTFVVGTGVTSELLSHLSVEVEDNELFLSDRTSTFLPPDLLIISGLINNKNLAVIRREYKKLTGKKFVVYIGNVSSEMSQESYHSIKNLEEHINIDLIIPGNPPSKEEIFDALGKLKGMR